MYDNILGDPYYEKFEDKIITFSSLEFAVYFDYIEKNVDFKKIDVFLEIGAGLGMFARNLKIKYPHIK